MFGLNEAEFNIVKRAAKDCVNEIADRIEQKTRNMIALLRVLSANTISQFLHC